MTGFLRQEWHLWTDTVETTWKGLEKSERNSQVDDIANSDFLLELSKLRNNLTNKIKEKSIDDDLVKMIVESGNNDITKLVENFRNNTIKSFDDFNNEFLYTFYGEEWYDVSNYIDNVIAQAKLAQETNGSNWRTAIWFVADALGLVKAENQWKYY